MELRRLPWITFNTCCTTSCMILAMQHSHYHGNRSSTAKGSPCFDALVVCYALRSSSSDTTGTTAFRIRFNNVSVRELTLKSWMVDLNFRPHFDGRTNWHFEGSTSSNMSQTFRTLDSGRKPYPSTSLALGASLQQFCTKHNPPLPLVTSSFLD